MPQLTPEQVSELYSELESLGEETVTANVNSRVYGESKLPHVHTWLIRKDKDRQSFREDEQTSIAKSAKDAAWVSANAAERSATEAHQANRTAKAALAIAAIAVAVAIAGLLF